MFNANVDDVFEEMAYPFEPVKFDLHLDRECEPGCVYCARELYVEDMEDDDELPF